MPRRSTSKKKLKKRDSGGEKSAPTDFEWTKMKGYGSFTVSDGDGNIYKFMRGQTATVLPHHYPPGSNVPQNEYWVVKIKDIRAFEHEDDTNEVWVRVQWYYSAEDVASVVKSFNPKFCGRYERIFSDHYDFVWSEAFNEVIVIPQLRDDDPEQPPIDRDAFYTRYNLERQTRRLKPKPGTNSCTCGKPHNPDDETETSIMHFCPRPSCRKWYHQTCLVKQGSRESCSAKLRSMHLISTSADDDSKKALYEHALLSPFKRTRKSTSAESRATRSDESDPTVRDVLARLPDSLVLVAEQPIVRGALYDKGGISGNVRPVVQSRRLIYDALEGKELPEEWEEQVLGQITSTTLDDAVVRITGKKTIPPLLCPQCKSAI